MGAIVEIKLNTNRSYYAGKTVDGRVVIHCTKLEKVKGILISLKGQGVVHYTRRASGLINCTINDTNKETYVSLRSFLAGDGVNTIILPEGVSTYPFHFELPTNIPSSFSSQLGSRIVSYALRVEIARSGQKLEARVHLPITVKGILDLNLQLNRASLPQELKVVKGSSKKKLTVILTIPNRSGFVPGEYINFTAEVANDANKKVKSMTASLKQVTKLYVVEGEKKSLNKTLTQIFSHLNGPDMTEKKYEWTGNLYVPPVPPTKLGGNCRIIVVRYYLYFEMKTSGVDNCLTGELPVIIGTIPLRSTDGSSRPVSSTFPSTSQQDGPGNAIATTSTSLSPDYLDLPPLSYAEALAATGVGSVINQEEDGSCKIEDVYTHDSS